MEAKTISMTIKFMLQEKWLRGLDSGFLFLTSLLRISSFTLFEQFFQTSLLFQAINFDQILSHLSTVEAKKQPLDTNLSTTWRKSICTVRNIFCFEVYLAAKDHKTLVRAQNLGLKPNRNQRKPRQGRDAESCSCSSHSAARRLVSFLPTLVDPASCVPTARRGLQTEKHPSRCASGTIVTDCAKSHSLTRPWMFLGTWFLQLLYNLFPVPTGMHRSQSLL